MIYDTIVIGAGPCGLAVAARLRENTPSALFTDAEHARYWRRHSRQAHTIEKEAKRKRRSDRHQEQDKQDEHGSTRYNPDDYDIDSTAKSERNANSLSMLVLDASSEHWMSTWHTRFEALNISHLRSPLFFHCDPRDRDGLLEYSHTESRSNELAEINNVVGREVSKHQKKKGKKRPMTRHLHLDNRDQIDYYTPSTSLFHDYCDCLIDRYDLSKLVHKATVTSIAYGSTSISTQGDPLFTLTTATNQIFLARTVVIAVGSGKQPSIPPDYKFLHNGSASHIFEKSQPVLLPPHLSSRSRTSRSQVAIAVIGGGLTSAQIVSILLTQHGIGKVHLIMRSKLKIKHFDVDLEWVSKLRNANMAAFWSADTDSERFEMLRCARNGGSVPPKWAKLLRNLEKEGRLQCWEDTHLANGTWHDRELQWDLDLQVIRTTNTQDPTTETVDGTPKAVPMHKAFLTGIDHVICATGLGPNINNVDFLANFRTDHPVALIAGLPQIHDDLRWTDSIPLFLTGALAGLRLGPGAGNLAGARLGAERIAWGIDNTLADGKGSASSVASDTKVPMSSRLSDVDSAYGSTTSDLTGWSDEGAGNVGQATRNHSVIDRSEFTGGFSNQFEALAV